MTVFQAITAWCDGAKTCQFSHDSLPDLLVVQEGCQFIAGVIPILRDHRGEAGFVGDDLSVDSHI